MKKVKLVLEWDAGLWEDDDLIGMETPKSWGEHFYQTDVFPGDMQIVCVTVEDLT